MLLTIGDLVEDVVVLLPGTPSAGTDTTCRITRSRGGSAANVASAAVAAGGRARLLARVGDDPLGDTLVASLADAGVEVAHVQRAGRTGTIVVLVTPGGERTMLTDRGASADLEPDPRALEAVAAVHVPAYSLDVARPLLDEARRRGILRSVDASSTGMLRERGRTHWRAALEEVAPDVLFADAGEAAFLGLDEEPLSGPSATVVKDGPRPARLLRPGAVPVAVPPAPVDAVVDTTGAGDAFAAGWLVATTAGADPEEATRRAHAHAARVLAHAGAAVR